MMCADFCPGCPGYSPNMTKAEMQEALQRIDKKLSALTAIAEMNINVQAMGAHLTPKTTQDSFQSRINNLTHELSDCVYRLGKCGGVVITIITQKLKEIHYTIHDNLGPTWTPVAYVCVALAIAAIGTAILTFTMPATAAAGVSGATGAIEATGITISDLAVFNNFLSNLI